MALVTADLAGWLMVSVRRTKPKYRVWVELPLLGGAGECRRHAVVPVESDLGSTRSRLFCPSPSPSLWEAHPPHKHGVRRHLRFGERLWEKPGTSRSMTVCQKPAKSPKSSKGDDR